MSTTTKVRLLSASISAGVQPLAFFKLDEELDTTGGDDGRRFGESSDGENESEWRWTNGLRSRAHVARASSDIFDIDEDDAENTPRSRRPRKLR